MWTVDKIIPRTAGTNHLASEATSWPESAVLSPPPLWLLNSRSTSRHQIVYAGFCLNSERPHSEELDERPVYVANCDGVVTCRLAQHQVNWYHASTNEGSFYVRDGNTCRRHSDDEYLQWTAANPVSLVKFSPALDLKLPAFVGGAPELAPLVWRISVRFLVSRWNELPDINVDLAKLVGRFSSRNAALSSQCSQAELPFAKPRLSIPVELSAGTSTELGLLHILQELPDRWSAKLYFPTAATTLQAGMTLARRARRDTKYRGFRAEAAIAEVIDIESCSPMENELVGDGFVTLDLDGEELPVVCTSCGTHFEPDAFNPDEMQVIDLWGWLNPWLREIHSPYTDAGRKRFARENAAKYSAALDGRKVHCPQCRTGTVVLKDDR